MVEQEQEEKQSQEHAPAAEAGGGGPTTTKKKVTKKKVNTKKKKSQSPSRPRSPRRPPATATAQQRGRSTSKNDGSGNYEGQKMKKQGSSKSPTAPRRSQTRQQQAPRKSKTPPRRRSPQPPSPPRSSQQQRGRSPIRPKPAPPPPAAASAASASQQQQQQRPRKSKTPPRRQQPQQGNGNNDKKKRAVASKSKSPPPPPPRSRPPTTTRSPQRQQQQQQQTSSDDESKKEKKKDPAESSTWKAMMPSWPKLKKNPNDQKKKQVIVANVVETRATLAVAPTPTITTSAITNANTNTTSSDTATDSDNLHQITAVTSTSADNGDNYHERQRDEEVVNNDSNDAAAAAAAAPASNDDVAARSGEDEAESINGGGSRDDFEVGVDEETGVDTCSNGVTAAAKATASASNVTAVPTSNNNNNYDGQANEEEATMGHESMFGYNEEEEEKEDIEAGPTAATTAAASPVQVEAPNVAETSAVSTTTAPAPTSAARIQRVQQVTAPNNRKVEIRDGRKYEGTMRIMRNGHEMMEERMNEGMDPTTRGNCCYLFCYVFMMTMAFVLYFVKHQAEPNNYCFKRKFAFDDDRFDGYNITNDSYWFDGDTYFTLSTTVVCKNNSTVVLYMTFIAFVYIWYIAEAVVGQDWYHKPMSEYMSNVMTIDELLDTYLPSLYSHDENGRKNIVRTEEDDDGERKSNVKRSPLLPPPSLKLRMECYHRTRKMRQYGVQEDKNENRNQYTHFAISYIPLHTWKDVTTLEQREKLRIVYNKQHHRSQEGPQQKRQVHHQQQQRRQNGNGAMEFDIHKYTKIRFIHKVVMPSIEHGDSDTSVESMIDRFKRLHKKDEKQVYCQEFVMPGFKEAILISPVASGVSNIALNPIVYWFVHVTVVLSLPYRMYLSAICEDKTVVCQLSFEVKCDLHKCETHVGRCNYVCKNRGMIVEKSVCTLTCFLLLGVIAVSIVFGIKGAEANYDN